LRSNVIAFKSDRVFQEQLMDRSELQFWVLFTTSFVVREKDVSFLWKLFGMLTESTYLT
jgi:hypothetical protein